MGELDRRSGIGFVRLATSQRNAENKQQRSLQENWNQQAQLHVTPQAVAISDGRKDRTRWYVFHKVRIFTEIRASHSLNALPALAITSFDKTTLQIGYIYMKQNRNRVRRPELPIHFQDFAVSHSMLTRLFSFVKLWVRS
jgi:hypothetical protein